MEKLLSIIIPAYNEAGIIPTTYKTIDEIMSQNNISYELLFIDDGSTDESYSIIESIAGEHPQVHGVSFSRNFGKEAAIFAGLKEAKGDCCVLIDCDLQHPPAKIPEMYRLWEEGYQVVQGMKSSRGKESFLHKLSANFFYSLIYACSDIKLKNASDFVLMDRVAVDSLLEMPERAPFFRGLSHWIGFKTVQVEFEVAERTVGTTKWSLGGLFRYAINNITTFSSKPLQLITVMGFVFILLSVLQIIEALYRYFNNTALGGFTTVIILILLSNGLVMVSLGIIGQYISHIYNEVKARPRYIVNRKC